MRTVTVFVFVAVVGVVSTASAQTVKDGELSGQILSAGATAAPGTSVTLLTTPATGFYVLTHAVLSGCTGSISASGFGPIVSHGNSSSSYTPGIALPPSSTITCTSDACSTPAIPATCVITGVLSKK